MKKIAAVVAFGVFVFAAGLSFAESSNKVKNASFANSNIHKLGMRFRQAMDLIQKDQKSGKLTPAQAKDLRGKIGAIRKQEVSFMKTNGKKEITDTQASQLNGQLDQLQPSL